MNVVLPLGNFFCEPEDLGDHPGFASVNVRAFLEWLYPKRKISASEVPALLERIADATAATKHRTKGYIWCPISVVTIPTVGDDEIWDDDIELAVANFVAAGLRGHPASLDPEVLADELVFFGTPDWSERWVEALRHPDVTRFSDQE